VRELPLDEREADDHDDNETLTRAERDERARAARWVHYPGSSAEENVERESFKEAEQTLLAVEREARRESARRGPILLDLDRAEDVLAPDDAPLGLGRREHLGHLVACGGQGGLGNPHFVSAVNRSPKWATKGRRGGRVTLELELKLLADVGLVGVPNAGKSTLLRAITGGRAKSEVAAYAFTTLNPVVGVVRVADDGTFEGGVQGQMVFDESAVEERLEREQENGWAGSQVVCPAARDSMGLLEDHADVSSGSQATSRDIAELLGNHHSESDIPLPQEPPEHAYRPGHDFDLAETFRFTIADNPGLIHRASENVGLGHSFLRSMERSLALVYVVDLSAPAPWDDVRVLRDELERYQAGLSLKARLIVANKADLLAGEEEEGEEVARAREKLRRLEEFVRNEMVGAVDVDGRHARPLDVIPVSAKYAQNLRKVVAALRGYVEEARASTGSA
jgi:GTP-binding protein